MRRLGAVLAEHPEVSVQTRSDIFKSAFFMERNEHTSMVLEYISTLESAEPATKPRARNLPVMISGIIYDSPSLLGIMDALGYHIVADDVAAQSRQYRTDADQGGAPLEALADKFARMDHCSVLFDPDKKRADLIVETVRKSGAAGVILFLTKFCDPEEFDYVIIKRACHDNGIPLVLIEVDRQMTNYEQARTALEAFREMLSNVI
jgi:benzoyl-CoA reductase/2-hydroxyglutaryl-CoA dehydratase subunit BcrC/BadD/HgdB